MNEKQFEDQVIDLAHLNGFRVAHFTQAQVRPGVWATPVKADGKGFPDLVLVRDRVIFAELKSDRGSVRIDQGIWAQSLTSAGAEMYLWRPKDLEEIAAVLSRR